MRNELAKEQEEVNQQIQAECLQVIAKFHMAYQEALGNRRSQGLTAEETIEVNRVAAQVDHAIRQFKQQLNLKVKLDLHLSSAELALFHADQIKSKEAEMSDLIRLIEASKDEIQST